MSHVLLLSLVILVKVFIFDPPLGFLFLTTIYRGWLRKGLAYDSSEQRICKKNQTFFSLFPNKFLQFTSIKPLSCFHQTFLMTWTSWYINHLWRCVLLEDTAKGKKGNPWQQTKIMDNEGFVQVDEEVVKVLIYYKKRLRSRCSNLVEDACIVRRMQLFPTSPTRWINRLLPFSWLKTQFINAVCCSIHLVPHFNITSWNIWNTSGHTSDAHLVSFLCSSFHNSLL